MSDETETLKIMMRRFMWKKLVRTAMKVFKDIIIAIVLKLTAAFCKTDFTQTVYFVSIFPMQITAESLRLLWSGGKKWLRITAKPMRSRFMQRSKAFLANNLVMINEVIIINLLSFVNLSNLFL